MLALTGTRLKGKGKVSWCNVNGIMGVKEIERLRNVWHSAVIDFICLTSRTLWVKFKFSRVKVSVVVVCGQTEVDV